MTSPPAWGNESRYVTRIISIMFQEARVSGKSVACLIDQRIVAKQRSRSPPLSHGLTELEGPQGPLIKIVNFRNQRVWEERVGSPRPLVCGHISESPRCLAEPPFLCISRCRSYCCALTQQSGWFQKYTW